jgi:hypothetical protein
VSISEHVTGFQEKKLVLKTEINSMIFIYIDVNYRSYVTKEKYPTSLELKVEKNHETLTIG